MQFVFLNYQNILFYDIFNISTLSNIQIIFLPVLKKTYKLFYKYLFLNIQIIKHIWVIKEKNFCLDHTVCFIYIV